VEIVVTAGAPLRELLRRVAKCRAGLLVVGARGASGRDRVLLGSVANGALNRGPVPVIIVPMKAVRIVSTQAGSCGGIVRAPERRLVRRLLMAGLLSCAALACTDRDRDLPRSYRQLEVPSISADAVARGSLLFAEYCALCHGERGDGQGRRREGLTHPPRDFTSAAWHRSASPRHVFHAIREGVANSPMPNWKALSEQDAWDLTAYVLSLAQE
jgi:mono/diheme cytochrome c family protein